MSAQGQLTDPALPSHDIGQEESQGPHPGSANSSEAWRGTLSIASGVQRGPQAWLLPESPVVGPWEEGGATMRVGIQMESQW